MLRIIENVLFGLFLFGLAVFALDVLVPDLRPYTGWGIGLAIPTGFFAMIINRVRKIRERVAALKAMKQSG